LETGYVLRQGDDPVTEVAISKGPNRVGDSLTSSEQGKCPVSGRLPLVGLEYRMVARFQKSTDS
jgi:hypothetical protein